MHLTPERTALSPTAINGLKKKGLKAMLQCNAHVKNNDCNKFIRCRIFANANEWIMNLDVGCELKNIDMILTDLVEQKIGNATNSTYEKVEQTYAAVVAVEKFTVSMQGKAEYKAEYILNDISQSFRIQGIPEDPTKTKGENLVPINDEVTEILSQIGATPKVLELKHLAKLSAEWKKPRTLLITVSSEHEARLTLAKSHERREVYYKKNVYILPASSNEDAIK